MLSGWYVGSLALQRISTFIPTRLDCEQAPEMAHSSLSRFAVTFGINDFKDDKSASKEIIPVEAL
jgi:hypothetical protein